MSLLYFNKYHSPEYYLCSCQIDLDRVRVQNPMVVTESLHRMVTVLTDSSNPMRFLPTDTCK